MTEAKLRAQRANARLSRGPRTEAGRRRSALNRRQVALKPGMEETMGRGGVDPEEFRRLFRDLLALFWFVDRELERFLETLAWVWWHKLDEVRRGGAEAARGCDGKIEDWLDQYVAGFKWRNPRWDYWLAKSFGSGCDRNMAKLRRAVEARLIAFRKAAIEVEVPQGGPHPPNKVSNEPKAVSY